MNAVMLMVCVAGSTAVGQPPEDTIFKAPRIEVKTGMHDDNKMYSYLLYNRIHIGMQYDGATDRRVPTTYFHDKSPIGLVLKDAKAFPPKAEPPVLVLGMDVGTLAAYAQPGQTFHFTERVPTFVKFSLPDKGEKRYFTYVQDALDRGAKVKIFEGEPRAMLEKQAADKFYKVIVVETYKMPVVEIHKELLTKEALQVLISKTTEDGIVCFHTSNRYYQLAPIIASAAKELKLACIVGHDAGGRSDPKGRFRFSSEWVMVARAEKHLGHLKNDKSHQVDWSEARVQAVELGKFSEVKIDREFLWTDKGEKSFRGLFNSDPEIANLQYVVADVEAFFIVSVGISQQRTSRVSRPLGDLISAWSRASAVEKNRGSPLASKEKIEKK